MSLASSRRKRERQTLSRRKSPSRHRGEELGELQRAEELEQWWHCDELHEHRLVEELP
jgi:hypothetical protein